MLACGSLDGHVQKMIYRAREHESDFVVVDTFESWERGGLGGVGFWHSLKRLGLGVAGRARLGERKSREGERKERERERKRKRKRKRKRRSGEKVGAREKLGEREERKKKRARSQRERETGRERGRCCDQGGRS